MTDLDLQGMALDLAREAGEAGEVPIGALVVRGGAVIGRGRNRMEELQDATAHAEMFALRQAASTLGTWRLDGCQLFASLEPCPMCAGAILNSRIGRVVYGAPDHRLGACRTHWALLERNPVGRVVEVVEGLLGEESAKLLRSFFHELRSGDRDRASDRRSMGGRDEIA
jgi:tRNA(adenine34) deaminase